MTTTTWARDREIRDLKRDVTREYAPLTRDQEREYLELLARYVTSPAARADAEDRLVRGQLAWVFRFAVAYTATRRYMGVSDAYAVGLEAVLRCVRKYDVTRHYCRLMALARVAVRRRVDQQEPAYWPGLAYPVGINQRTKVGSQRCVSSPLEAAVTTWDQDHTAHLDAEQAAEQILDVLNPQVAAIVCLRFGLDGTGVERSGREVAQIIGSHGSTVSKVLRAAFAGVARSGKELVSA